MTPKQEGSARSPATIAAAVVLLGVALVYAPSLSGGWVWDDHSLLGANPALANLGMLLTRDVWGPSGTPSDLYRPLVMLTHVGQNVLPGPLLERLLNLALHLAAVALVAQLARRAGAAAIPAWVGAALFGLHPGASEPVAWVTGRHDLLPAMLFLAGAAALAARRDLAAGLVFALLPFAKEPYLLAPLALVPLLLAQRRLAPAALVPAVAGVAAYLVARQVLELPLPAGAAGALGPGSVGAVAARGLSLALVPASADAVAAYRPNVPAGILAGLFGLALLPFVRRFEVALVVSALVLLAPTAPAAAQIDVVADRYFYLLFAAVGVVVGVGLSRAWERPAARLAALVPLLLAPLTAMRGMEWRSDAAIFGASLRLHPENAHAAFHVAYDLHTRAGDCAAAVPLYRQAVDAEPRARNNLLACLLDLRRYPDAVALGPEAAAKDPANPNPAANTARAYAELGDLDAAEQWAVTATERAPTSAKHWTFLGNVRGKAGRLDGAAEAFGRALRLEPGAAEATRGLALVQARLEAGVPTAGGGGVAGGARPPLPQEEEAP